MPHDPHLGDLMRQALATRRGVTEKRMFGGYCWMLNGNMLCGVEVGRFMFRVGKDLAPEALARPGVDVVSFSDRRANGLVWVNADACIDEGLDSWIELAAKFVGALAPK